MLSTMSRTNITAPESAIRVEPGTAADSYAIFMVFERAYADLTHRQGITETASPDPEMLARVWLTRQPLYEHLATTADQFWLARRNDDIVGFARSILRGDVRLLTEFFILPDEQSAGLGRELLARALPHQDAKQRWLVATTDLRAQALYLKNGLYPQFPAYYFRRPPRLLAPPASDLEIENASPSAATFQAMADIDARILGFRRDVDHHWLATDRQAYLYCRAGQPVGYGYIGSSSGPFALLEVADYPAVLAHAESETARQGRPKFGLEVPMVNHHAVNYLLANGFRIDSFMAQFMSDGPTAHFENYILTSPPFIV